MEPTVGNGLWFDLDPSLLRFIQGIKNCDAECLPTVKAMDMLLIDAGPVEVLEMLDDSLVQRLKYTRCVGWQKKNE